MAWRRGIASGTATVGVLGLLALAGLALGAFAAHAYAPGSAAAPNAAPNAHFATAAHPAFVATVGVVITDPVLPATSVPGQIWINFTVTTIGAPINGSVSNASVEMIAETGPTAPYTDIAFANWAVPVNVAVATNTTTLSTNDSAANVLPNTHAWVNPPNQWLPNGRYLFEAFFTTPDTNGVPVTGEAQTGNISGHGDTQLVVASHTPWMAMVSPANGSAISPGVTTVAASFGGDWVQSATVNITNPLGDSVVSADLQLLQNDPTWIENHTVIITTSGQLITPGAYTVTLTETLGYSIGGVSSWTWKQGFTVSNATTVQTPVWENTTVYKNSTGGGGTTQLIGGVSPGATAAILMVVGLIIGMIVALILGRMMFSGSSSSAPAQPWSGTKAGNECSVCHQSFASEAELKDHQKTAHGM